MSVAVMSTEALWVVEASHTERNWFAMQTAEDEQCRAVFVKCEPHQRQWWKMLVTASLPHPGRLSRLLEFFHREGGHVAVVSRIATGPWWVEHHLQGDRFENIYSPSALYTIVNLGDIADARIVQRTLDAKRHDLDMCLIQPDVLLQKLIDDGLIDGVLTKIDLKKT